MKKFFVSLLILAVFSGTVFFIGWTQIKVKPDSMGIVVSKTDGIQDEPVLPGVFSWSKQFLLPTNAQILTFSIKPVNVEKSISGELPSASFYNSAFNASDSFTYDFDFSFSVTVSPQDVVSLYRENKISSSQDLSEYLDKACDYIAQLACDYYLKKASDNPSFRPETVRRDDLVKSIQAYKEYPEIEISTLAVTKSKIPDYALYRQLQNSYINQQSINKVVSEEETSGVN